LCKEYLTAAKFKQHSYSKGMNSLTWITYQRQYIYRNYKLRNVRFLLGRLVYRRSKALCVCA